MIKNENIDDLKKAAAKAKKPKDNKEVIKLKEANALLNEKIIRLNADMVNMKRRNEEEIAKAYKYDGEELIKELLPIVDNFERAILLDDENLTDELSKFLSGFKMIYGNLLSTLNEKGVSQIDCLNKEFDPNTMQAVLTEHIDGINPGVVIDVMQKGYIYKEKVIRPAMVKVSE